jgi:hypothetical protein
MKTWVIRSRRTVGVLLLTPFLFVLLWLQGGGGAQALTVDIREAYALLSGLLAAASFAVGAPFVGIALCGSLVGAVLGGYAGNLVADRALFGASEGATVGTVAAGAVGLQHISRVRPPCFPKLLRGSALVVLIAGRSPRGGCG